MLAALLLGGVTLLPQAAPGPTPPSYRPADGQNDCSANWRSAVLEVEMDGCQALYFFDYSTNNFSNPDMSNNYNFSFSIPYLVELNATGGLVRSAWLIAAVSSFGNLTTGPSSTVYTSLDTLNVTHASGAWTPNDTSAGPGPQWKLENDSVGAPPTVGTAQVEIVFHFSSGSAPSSRIKFDLNVLSWPWQDPRDTLGVEIDSMSAANAHIESNASARTLGEAWNGTEAPFAQLLFGPTANATFGANGSSSAQVGVQFGAYQYGIRADGVALLNFTGARGGYSTLEYDPWLSFQPTLPPASPGPGPGSVPFADSTLAAAAVLAGIVAVGGGIAVRRRRLRRESEELVRDMRTLLTDRPGGPSPPR